MGNLNAVFAVTDQAAAVMSEMSAQLDCRL